MHRITTGATVRTAGDGLRTFTISTASEDRDGDVLEPTGIVATAYMRNPVVLWAHDYFAPPIGRSRSLRATVDSRLEADVEFAPTDFAQEVKLLVDQGAIPTPATKRVPRTGLPPPRSCAKQRWSQRCRIERPVRTRPSA